MLVHRSVPPSIKFTGTHLQTWVRRGTVWVKCLTRESQQNVPHQSSNLGSRTHKPWGHRASGCVLGKDTYSPECLSPSRCVIGYQQIVVATWQNTARRGWGGGGRGGGSLRCTSIPSRREQKYCSMLWFRGFTCNSFGCQEWFIDIIIITQGP